MANDKTPDANAPLLDGGPEPAPEPVAPKLVTVKYGGRELSVPEDVASAWQEREKEFNQSFSRQGAELGELRKRATQPAPAPREEPKEPDIDTLWFENPKAAYQKIVSEVETRVESKYRQDQAQKNFWEGFYRANDDLREDEWVVRGVMNEHWSDLESLSPREAQKKLADLTRTELLRIARKTKTPTDREPALLEPASGDRPPRPSAAEDDDKPVSLSSMIRDIRQQKIGKVRAKGA